MHEFVQHGQEAVERPHDLTLAAGKTVSVRVPQG